MKARAVKGLDPDATLADNLERIVATRLDELCSFVPRALDPTRMKALHDMRIAAKRLRYILEVGAEPCFGPYAVEPRSSAPRTCRTCSASCTTATSSSRACAPCRTSCARADALEARARAGDAPDLDPTLASGTPHAPAWRGLETLRIYVEARRGLLFERFAGDVARPGARGLPRAPGVRDQRAPRSADPAFTIRQRRRALIGR